MGYVFRLKDEDLTATLQRVALEELSAALAQLASGAPEAAGVHDVRKRIKKLRGALRLCRAGANARLWSEIAVLRDVAQALSALRDAEVMLGWHDRLAQGVPEAVSAGVLRAGLAARVEAARTDPALPARIEAAHATLEGMAGRVPQWRVKGKDAAVLQAGLARTLARASKAMTTARQTGGTEAEAFHDWRKRTKDLWYQTRLLSAVWPEGIGLWQGAADQLGEMLGEHHDLEVFVALTETIEGEAAAEALALRAQARRMSADIEARAFKLGARLLAGDPQGVAALWVAWWRVWRTET